jgi:hypothetical protein
MRTKFYDRRQNKVKANRVLQKLKPAKKCYILNAKYMAAVVTTYCVTKEEESRASGLQGDHNE